MRTAWQVSEIERRFPRISPRIEFRVYIPLLAGESSGMTTNTLPSSLATNISPKEAVNIKIAHFPRDYLIKIHNVPTWNLVETLCYKSEGRGFDSRRCHWNF